MGDGFGVGDQLQANPLQPLCIEWEEKPTRIDHLFTVHIAMLIILSKLFFQSKYNTSCCVAYNLIRKIFMITITNTTIIANSKTDRKMPILNIASKKPLNIFRKIHIISGNSAVPITISSNANAIRRK